MPQIGDCQMYKHVSVDVILTYRSPPEGGWKLQRLCCKQNYFFLRMVNFQLFTFFFFHSDAHLLGKRVSTKKSNEMQLFPNGSFILWILPGCYLRCDELGCRQFSIQQLGADFICTALPSERLLTALQQMIFIWLLITCCTVMILFLGRRFLSASMYTVFS